MKQKFIILAFTGLLASGLITSCNSSENKMETAAENVDEAQKNLDEAERRYAEEWEKFKLESEERIRNNENEIVIYREREKTDKEFSRKYREAIDKLEAQNEEMKIKMREGRENAKNRWEEFKREWNHDMDELGTAIKDLGRDNKN